MYHYSMCTLNLNDLRVQVDEKNKLSSSQMHLEAYIIMLKVFVLVEYTKEKH